jgi:Tfp pilus assembly protein PilO
MTTSTISAKIPQDQRDRLDAIAAAEDIAVSRLVATAIEQYLQQPAIGPQTETEAPTMPPHPLQPELDAKYSTIERLTAEISELEEGITAIEFKLTTAGRQVEVTPTGDGLLGQIGDRLALRATEAEQRQAIAELEKTLKGAIDLLTSKRSQLEQTRTVIDGMEMQLAADAERAIFQGLADRYHVRAEELNTIAREYNASSHEAIRCNRARVKGPSFIPGSLQTIHTYREMPFVANRLGQVDDRAGVWLGA